MRNLNLIFLLFLLGLIIKLNSACAPSLDLGDLDTETKILIPPRETCVSTTKKSKKVFYCYHGGVCEFKTIRVNETHYTKSYYCVCPKGYGGNDCRQDNTFLLDIQPLHDQSLRYTKPLTLNVVLFIILLLITFSFILYLLMHYQNGKENKTETNSNNDDSSKQMLTV